MSKSYDLTAKLDAGLDVRICSKWDWVLFNSIFVNDEYVGCLQHVRRHSPKLTIVDLGCNVGYFSAWLINKLRLPLDKESWQLYAVDGSRKNYERYVADVEKHSSNIKALHGLVGERKGSTNFAEVDFHPMNRIVEFGQVNNIGSGMEVSTIDYIDLDELLPLVPIDLLKVDIEGSERRFFEIYDDILARTHCLVVELHHTMVNVKTCRELLATQGLNNHRVLWTCGDVSLEIFTR